MTTLLQVSPPTYDYSTLGKLNLGFDFTAQTNGLTGYVNIGSATSTLQDITNLPAIEAITLAALPTISANIVYQYIPGNILSPGRTYRLILTATTVQSPPPANANVLDAFLILNVLY